MPSELLTTHGLGGPLGDPRVTQIDLHVRKGELLHIHGASGSGKTTLLRLLARLDPAHEGTLRLAGQDAQDIPPTTWRRRVCLVFQESRVFPMSLEENLRWGARQHGIPVDIDSLLHRVDLKLDPATPAQQISGGEAKRLAIARSLAVRPDVLLLDEPTGPLDEEHRRSLRDLVRRLQQDGLGILFVSHLEEDLHHLPGHAIHLESGKIRSQGPSKQLYQRRAQERPA